MRYSAHFKNHVFFNFALELYEFLIYFDTNPLPSRWLANIFSHSVDCLFIFYDSFCCAEFLQFDVVPLIILPLLLLFLVSYLKNHGWYQCTRAFRDLNLMFKFLIHFELIFVFTVTQGSKFILLLMIMQFSQHFLFFSFQGHNLERG